MYCPHIFISPVIILHIAITPCWHALGFFALKWAYWDKMVLQTDSGCKRPNMCTSSSSNPSGSVHHWYLCLSDLLNLLR